MIRFSAALVVVGLGLLVAGAFASELVLVYAAIAVCVLASALLATGVVIGRDEILGHDVKTAVVTRESDRAAVSAFSVPVQVSSAESAQDAMAGAPSQTAGAGQSSSGLGWPAGESPTEALWARVDAELAVAGTSVDNGPKLTKDSATDEVWDRVELELNTPATWSSQFSLHQPATAKPEAVAPFGSSILNGPESTPAVKPADSRQVNGSGVDGPDDDDDQWLAERWDAADDWNAAAA
ncbi:MAG: hypothetical protein ACRDNF_16880, partial [Streptosporangiaceae bacterium]